MCVQKEQAGLVLLGIGVGLFFSFLLCGWFLRSLFALVFLAAGFLLLK